MPTYHPVPSAFHGPIPQLRHRVARKPAFVDNYDLPSSYNETNLTLIARDPHWVHAYWEITPTAIEEIRSKIGSEFDRSTITLRMHDVTCVDFNGHNANRSFDIDVGPHAHSWYVNLWCDNVSYCGDIGVRSPEGNFYVLARSNMIETPRAGSSGRGEMIWMRVDDEEAEPPYVLVEETLEAKKAKGRSVKKVLPSFESKATRHRIYYLTEDDIRAYYSRLFPNLRRVLRRGKGSLGREGVDLSGRKYRIVLKDGEVIFDDILLKNLSKRQFLKKILGGASEELFEIGELGGSESAAKGGASERKELAKRRQFFFELWTELLVYGRTEPDAEVWHGNKWVKLRDDGTFSLRFALPDGRIPLEFVALSKDKTDKRSIVTAVERQKTIYHP
ncbi:MAG: DUF4912 domain-containing protein [Candidatus Omnitrophica bacterium]|nr:DUF4912 domain-containing protein [Candidatus Omnitrophota bacterium]